MSTDRSYYSKKGLIEAINGVITILNELNKEVDGYVSPTEINLYKTLRDKKQIPSSLFDDINGTGSNAIIPRPKCNAMKKKKNERCNNSVKKHGEEFCGYHQNNPPSQIWTEFQKQYVDNDDTLLKSNKIAKKLKEVENQNREKLKNVDTSNIEADYLIEE